MEELLGITKIAVLTGLNFILARGMIFYQSWSKRFIHGSAGREFIFVFPVVLIWLAGTLWVFVSLLEASSKVFADIESFIIVVLWSAPVFLAVLLKKRA